MATSPARASSLISNSSTRDPARPARRTRPFGVVAVGVLAAAVIASVVNIGIAAVAHGLGVSDQIPELSAGALSFFTVLGLAIGAIGWAIIARRAQRPAHLLSWLVPAVLALTLVPDVLLKTSNQPHITWGAVAALIIAHVVTAVIAVISYLRVMPVRAAEDR